MKIMNHQKEEDIAVQRYPLNSEILAKLATMALLNLRIIVVFDVKII